MNRIEINTFAYSVIIPTWNRSNSIEKAICSAQAQTIPPLEILVCDDGSSDKSRDLVHTISISDPRVKWLAGPRTGRPAVPRNRGIAESKGDWLAFLDSDDEWVPKKIESEITLAQELGLRAVCSNAKRLIAGNSDGELLSWDKDRLTFYHLIKENLVICSSAVIHRSLLFQIIGFPEDRELAAIEDYAFWLRVATQTTFAFVQEPLLIYSDNPKSSIRCEAGRFLLQHNHVLKNLLIWEKQQRTRKLYLHLTRLQLFLNYVKRVFST